MKMRISLKYGQSKVVGNLESQNDALVEGVGKEYRKNKRITWEQE